MQKHILNILILGLIGVSLPHVLSFVVSAVTPFTYNLDIHSLEYDDVCLGSNKQIITTSRTVRPEIIVADIDSVVWKNLGNAWVKTDITRSVHVPYEENGAEEFSIMIEWDKPFTELGVFGVSTVVEIQPYFIKKRQQELFTEKTFNVIEC